MALIKNLILKLDEFKLQIDQLELPDEGVIVFSGPSGSGKTTLFKSLIGVYEIPKWSWEFKNENLAQLKISDRKLGVVFQSYELFPHLTAQENIEIVIKSEPEKINEKINFWRNKLGLEKCWNTKAHKLSGGEKQRVALLRALVVQPRVLLLDEPFAALDQEIKQEARLQLKTLIQELSIPVYLITHDPDDIKVLGTYLVQIEKGGVKSVNSLSTSL